MSETTLEFSIAIDREGVWFRNDTRQEKLLLCPNPGDYTSTIGESIKILEAVVVERMIPELKKIHAEHVAVAVASLAHERGVN